MNIFDPLKAPLSSYSLIEASAGTGKTYTISQLILRLVLLGSSSDEIEPLSVENILVVTFTKAATKELKDRIRANLSQALSCLQKIKDINTVSAETVKGDLLAQLVHQSLQVHGRERSALLLQKAIFVMDEAPIFTIHGFCQHSLQTNALLTATPLQQSLEEDSFPVLLKLCQQLWRDEFYKLNSMEALWISQVIKSPLNIAQQLRAFLNPVYQESDEHFYSIDDFSKACQDISAQFDELKLLWVSERSDIEAMFDQKGLGTKYKKNHLPARLEAIDEYLLAEHKLSKIIANDKDKRIYLSQRFIDENCGLALEHAAFSAVDVLQSLQANLEKQFWAYLRFRLMELMQQHKLENQLWFFDDLIASLAHELTQGNNASVLQDQLRIQYPVALIDEFQDTDQQQFEIFDSIYQQREDSSLLMIGDPKQAIYSFRGADIQSYFYARSRVDESKIYSLATNWRSAPELVASVNRMFKSHSKAFVQKGFPEYPEVASPEAFRDKRCLSLASCELNDYNEDIESDDNNFALSVNTLEGFKNQSDYVAQAASETARFIHGILNSNSKLNGKVIEPKSIAILVRKSSQAFLMQEALREHNINSVFLSQDSVLSSVHTEPFIRLIEACLHPYETSIIKAALGDLLIACDHRLLDSLDDQPELLLIYQAKFAQARTLAFQKGFLHMWQYVLKAFEIETGLLSQPQGERAVTNLQQLSEIFSQEDSDNAEQQLQLFKHRYLLHTQGESQDTTQRYRLETEANLVEIVTIHSSKGLEYPIVCCPFVFVGEGLRPGFKKLYDESRSAYQVIYDATEKNKVDLLNAQLAEDVRLLYVALTRAQYHINLSWGLSPGVEKSALWQVLFDCQKHPKKDSVDHEMLFQFFTQDKHIAVNPRWPIKGIGQAGNGVSEDETAKHLKQEGLFFEQSLAYQKLERSLYEPLKARSYSAVIHDVHQTHGLNHQNASELDTMDDVDEQEYLDSLSDEAWQVSESIEAEDPWSIFSFPKGANAGNFLHLLYENIDFQYIDESFDNALTPLLKRYGFDLAWRDTLHHHCTQLLTKRFIQDSISLSELPEMAVKKEMAFHVMAKDSSGEYIARLLSQYRGGEAINEFKDIQGYFKGFIDLCFESQGKYFVLDYKSNHLGMSLEDYHQDAMQAAIHEHLYDLQYLIYCAALHLYLQQRIPDYEYDTHFGGVYYIFLRGINEADDSGIFFDRPERKVIETFAELFETGALHSL